MESNFVKIHVRFADAIDGPAGESPWAEPLNATDAGGTYRLQNDLFFVPLRHGDVVRCALDADSLLQVVGVVEVVPGVLLGFEHPPDTHAVVEAALELQIAAGFEATRNMDGFAEIFIPGATLDAMPAMPATPRGWELVERLDAAARLEAAERDIRFEVDAVPIFNEDPIDYWAAEDEAWARLGADDPAVLAAIQTLASRDLRVLATIRAGRHRDVLTYMERLSTPDPRDLPLLDRPLLVEPGAE